jgi:hypothetical protein
MADFSPVVQKACENSGLSRLAAIKLEKTAEAFPADYIALNRSGIVPFVRKRYRVREPLVIALLVIVGHVFFQGMAQAVFAEDNQAR